MTDDPEWKMIRFFGIPPNSVEWELRFLTRYGQNQYHPHTGDMSMIEPAPPKNWKPFCFGSACKRGESLGIMSMDKEPCLNCPFKKPSNEE